MQAINIVSMGRIYLYSMQDGRGLEVGECVSYDALPRIVGGVVVPILAGGQSNRPQNLVHTAIEPSVPVLGGMDYGLYLVQYNLTLYRSLRMTIMLKAS